MDYLLDTNILSHWYDPSSPCRSKVVARVMTARQPNPQTNFVPRFFVSAVTLGEIEYGARASHVPNPAKQAEYAAMDAAKIKFVLEQCPEVREITKHVAEQYGELRAWLFNNCSPRAKRSKKMRAEELVNPTTGKELGIDENDIWIAAQAKTHNLLTAALPMQQVCRTVFQTVRPNQDGLEIRPTSVLHWQRSSQ